MNRPPPTQAQLSGLRAFLVALLAMAMLAFGALVMVSAAIDFWAWSTIPACPRTASHGN